jgi:5-(aminomethyl)-3-furanmethanol phosphate kinase
VTGPAADGMLVVKVGGGLAAIPGALDAACAAVADLARRHRVVVVPGGGPFAEGVREFDRREGLGEDAAHWMAILAMDQYAHVLADRIERAVLVEEPGNIGPAVGAGRPAVLAPYRWMRSADVLPHSWDATSDSVAAFIAGALDAAHLVLVKPRDGPPEEMVDGCFLQVLPADLPWTVIGWERLNELPETLRRR